MTPEDNITELKRRHDFETKHLRQALGEAYERIDELKKERDEAVRAEQRLRLHPPFDVSGSRVQHDPKLFDPMQVAAQPMTPEQEAKAKATIARQVAELKQWNEDNEKKRLALEKELRDSCETSTREMVEGHMREAREAYDDRIKVDDSAMQFLKKGCTATKFECGHLFRCPMPAGHLSDHAWQIDPTAISEVVVSKEPSEPVTLYKKSAYVTWPELSGVLSLPDYVTIEGVRYVDERRFADVVHMTDRSTLARKEREARDQKPLRDEPGTDAAVESERHVERGELISALKVRGTIAGSWTFSNDDVKLMLQAARMIKLQAREADTLERIRVWANTEISNTHSAGYHEALDDVRALFKEDQS